MEEVAQRFKCFDRQVFIQRDCLSAVAVQVSAHLVQEHLKAAQGCGHCDLHVIALQHTDDGIQILPGFGSRDAQLAENIRPVEHHVEGLLLRQAPQRELLVILCLVSCVFLFLCGIQRLILLFGDKIPIHRFAVHLGGGVVLLIVLIHQFVFRRGQILVVLHAVLGICRLLFVCKSLVALFGDDLVQRHRHHGGRVEPGIACHRSILIFVVKIGNYIVKAGDDMGIIVRVVLQRIRFAILPGPHVGQFHQSRTNGPVDDIRAGMAHGNIRSHARKHGRQQRAAGNQLQVHGNAGVLGELIIHHGTDDVCLVTTGGGPDHNGAFIGFLHQTQSIVVGGKGSHEHLAFKPQPLKEIGGRLRQIHLVGAGILIVAGCDHQIVHFQRRFL